MAVVSRSPCAPPDGAGPKIRKSKATRWRAAVLIGIHLLAAIHVAHWLATGSTVSPFEPSEAMEFSKRSVVNAGLIFFVLLILSTLVFGRFACGWACHLVALQDLSRALLIKLGIRPKPLRSRVLLIVPIAAFVYMFLWPLAYRIWIGDSLALRAPELSKTGFWDTLPGWAVGIITLLVCGFAVVYFLGSKAFCAYACPYGAIFGVADKLAPGRIRVTDACEGCGHCTITCTSNVQVAQEVRDWGMVVDPGCMKCLDCVSVCPKDALYFGFGRPSLLAKPRRTPKTRRPAFAGWEEVVLALAFALAFFAFRGLYHMVPFLLSLGIAGIVAYTSLLVVRLGTERSVKLQNLTLKRDGRLTRTGRVLAAFTIPFVIFWAHSGLVRYHYWNRERHLDSMHELAAGWFESGRPAATADEVATAERLRSHASSYESLALVGDKGNALALAWASLWTGRDADFDRFLALAMERAPYDGTLPLIAGHQARAHADAESAARHYQRALQLAPELSGAASGLSEILALNGRVDDAHLVLERALATTPGSAGLHHDLGVLKAVLGNQDGAIESFREALALDPKLLEARSKLAQILMGSGHAAEGLALLEEGAALTPEVPEAHALLAQAQLALGELPGAEAATRTALRLAPELPELWALLAQVLTAQGDTAGAEEAMDTARSLSR